MRTSIILLVLCAFACFASATSIKKSQLHSNSNSTSYVQFTSNFQSTCSNIQLTGGSILQALCQNRIGGWATSTLNLSNCFGNSNGVFTCGGYYAASASNQYLSGSVLHASLRRIDGSWWGQTLDLNNHITNVNGVLTCECVQGNKQPSIH